MDPENLPCFFFFCPCGLWGLGFPDQGLNHAPYRGSADLTTGLLGKSQSAFFKSPRWFIMHLTLGIINNRIFDIIFISWLWGETAPKPFLPDDKTILTILNRRSQLQNPCWEITVNVAHFLNFRCQSIPLKGFLHPNMKYSVLVAAATVFW